MALVEYNRSLDQGRLVRDTNLEVLEVFYPPHFENIEDAGVGDSDLDKVGAICTVMHEGKTKLAVYQGDDEWLIVGDSSLHLGETADSAYRGDHGKVAYEHSQEEGNPHKTTATDVGAVSLTNNELVKGEKLFVDLIRHGAISPNSMHRDKVISVSIPMVGAVLNSTTFDGGIGAFMPTPDLPTDTSIYLSGRFHIYNYPPRGVSFDTHGYTFMIVDFSFRLTNNKGTYEVKDFIVKGMGDRNKMILGGNPTLMINKREDGTLNIIFPVIETGATHRYYVSLSNFKIDLPAPNFDDILNIDKLDVSVGSWRYIGEVLDSKLIDFDFDRNGDTMTGTLNLSSGTTTEPPVKIPIGTLTTVPQDGAIERDANGDYFVTNGVNRVKITTPADLLTKVGVNDEVPSVVPISNKIISLLHSEAPQVKNPNVIYIYVD